MPRRKTIIFNLVNHQKDILAPLFERALSAYHDGGHNNKGIIVAQINQDGRVECTFVEHDAAKKLTKIMVESQRGCKDPVG